MPICTVSLSKASASAAAFFASAVAMLQLTDVRELPTTLLIIT